MNCPFALQLEGPDWKRGYNYGTLHLTHEKTGVTIHTAEYDLAEDDKILYNALFSGRIASWHFTITKEGWLFQHYPVDTACWHAGYDANLWTVGIEMEGIAPDKISGPQYGLLVRLLRWLGNSLGWREWGWHRGDTRQKDWIVAGLYEHRDWMATDCAVFSRGMIDAGKLIADLKEEGVPGFTEEQEERIKEIVNWCGPGMEMQARMAVQREILQLAGSISAGGWAILPQALEEIKKVAQDWHRWKGD